MNKVMNGEQTELGSIEAIYFKDSDLKVSTFTEWRIVKCQTSVRLAIPNILIHPDSLSSSRTEIHTWYK
jgi:hypothetical protein